MELAAATGLNAEAVFQITNSLYKRGLLLQIEGCFLNLALRPREELIHKYFEDQQKENSSPISKAA